MTKLSIITINYNNAEGLVRTMESVSCQVFTDYEYIIIDGGSTDGSVDKIKSYLKKINYWISEKDNGVYHAMNKGIDASHGEYCLFLNSGDYLINEKVLSKVFSPNFTEDILYGNMKVDWNNGKITTEKMPKKITFSHMFRDTIWHPVSFIKKKLFDKYGKYNENYKIVADYEFFYKTIIEKKVSSRHLSFPISVFLFNGLSSNPENRQLEKDERMKVWKTYLTDEVIASEEQKIAIENVEKRKLHNRLINKLKSWK